MRVAVGLTIAGRADFVLQYALYINHPHSDEECGHERRRQDEAEATEQRTKNCLRYDRQRRWQCAGALLDERCDHVSFDHLDGHEQRRHP